ncbi:MAG: Holliday junction branch migration protein RuvA [Solirubrobacterales bacterium]
MYEYIKGIYTGMNKDYIVVENNGIGYRINTSGSTIAKIPQINEEVLIYIQQIVREDFIGLYGFLTKEELSMFNLLLTINGVGAKAALSLLSICSVLNLKYAIVSSDEKTIVRAPGIGKKIAQRIILELKDKLHIEDGTVNNSDINIENNETASMEALDALLSLGYTEKEAKQALKNVDQKDTIENIIKSCLRNLMG